MTLQSKLQIWPINTVLTHKRFLTECRAFIMQEKLTDAGKSFPENLENSVNFCAQTNSEVHTFYVNFRNTKIAIDVSGIAERMFI